MSTSRTLVWFRRDLRTSDHAALLEAAQSGAVCPVVVIPPQGHHTRPGAASAAWMHHSLISLNQQLTRLGAPLVVVCGLPEVCLPELAKDLHIDRVVVNAGQGPWDAEGEASVRTALSLLGVPLECWGTSWLVPPQQIHTGSGSAYQVFTPYWAATKKAWQPQPPDTAPTTLTSIPNAAKHSLKPSDWGLLPQHPWAASMMQHWVVGEPAARACWAAVLGGGLVGYATARQRPDLSGTTRLSPHLAWGEISVRELAWDLELHRQSHPSSSADAMTLWTELGWREFARYIWHHMPSFPSENWRATSLAWEPVTSAHWHAFTRGQTGLPMVDAAMRQLWSTGWMHNRSRMVVADFWCKHLGHHWSTGASWFAETLVDMDVASNALGWQWGSGTGPDAAPYHRVFNPVLQGQRFDPNVLYRRAWIPELASWPNAEWDEPWLSPKHAQSSYPAPLVTPQQGRARALSALKARSSS